MKSYHTFYLSADEEELFEERAAIMQYDGKISRAEANRKAFADIISLRGKDNTNENNT